MRAIALAALVLLTSCSTRFYDRQSGRMIASFQSDITDGAYSDGSTSFRFAKLSNSAPTRAALLGANKITSTVASAAVAAMVPGSGTTAVVSKTAISAVPHLSPTPSNP